MFIIMDFTFLFLYVFAIKGKIYILMHFCELTNKKGIMLLLSSSAFLFLILSNCFSPFCQFNYFCQTVSMLFSLNIPSCAIMER